MNLPDGRPVRARHSESYVYATLDPRLKAALKMDRDAFAHAYCLDRGVITHDGLPYFLPVEMQASVFAVILTAWELEMERPGDLTSYSLRTQHAAIRGHNFYQRQEPHFSNFMRLADDLGREPSFVSYPLASYLTHPWLGGNLRLVNQRSEGEMTLMVPLFMRSYYLQQLDWAMGVFNLCNTIEFRRRGEIEGALMGGGLAMHQMRCYGEFPISAPSGARTFTSSTAPRSAPQSGRTSTQTGSGSTRWAWWATCPGPTSGSCPNSSIIGALDNGCELESLQPIEDPGRSREGQNKTPSRKAKKA